MTSASGSNYYLAAENLREAIQFNGADTRFAADPNREIVYIIDTNVAEHYLNTRGDPTDGLLSFGQLFSDRSAKRVSDRLTLEFLLSGALPGQQLGTPIYLSAEHWNETLGRADKLAEKTSRLSRQLPAEGLIKLRGIRDPRELIVEAEKVVPEEILGAMKRTEAVRRRLERAFAGPRAKLRALDHAAYWQPAHDNVRYRDFVGWQATLTRRRREAANSRRVPQRREDASELQQEESRIRADASTLATIEALYRENPEACTDARTLQFVFVTADSAILAAVDERKDRLREDGIPLFVRHPRVYSPILNFSAMSERIPGALGGDAAREVFRGVEQAIEQLFEFLPEWQNDNLNEGKIRKVLRRWEAAARRLATANAHYFSGDSPDFEWLAERLSKSDALDAVSGMLRETIGAIRSEHAQLLSADALARLKQIMEGLARGAGEKGARRAPVKVLGIDLLADLPRVIDPSHGVKRLDELLDRLVQRESMLNLGMALAWLENKVDREWRTPAGQLLAACLFLSVGAWSSARECAERCQSFTTNKRSAMYREANYCIALALRFSIRSAPDLERARRALDANLADWHLAKEHDSLLAVLRDTIERAALLQSASVVQAIENVTPFTSYGPNDVQLSLMSVEQIPDEFDRSVSDMEQVSERLDSDYSGETRDPYMIVQFKRQLYINLAGAHVFRKLLGSAVSNEPYDETLLREAVARLDEVLGETRRPVPPVATVYRLLAGHLIKPDRKAVDTLLKLMDEVLKSDVLPLGDQIEFKFLANHLERERATLE